MTRRSTRREVVFLLDVDNTLLDNDALKADVAEKLERLLGKDEADRFWQVYEEVRNDESFVDYPETARRFAAGSGDTSLEDRVWSLLADYPFADRLYPGAIQTIRYLATLGRPVILSDGDPVYQPLKIQRSGLAEAVDGRVMIAVHKEEELDRVFATYPASHYVTVDDKPRILAALEECCSSTFTTVLVRQGKYAADESYSPKPDLVVGGIAELQTVDPDVLTHAGVVANRPFADE